MDITYFNNCKDNQSSNFQLNFSELIKFLEDAYSQKWSRSQKADRPAVIFGFCKGRRAAMNVETLSCIGADIDISPSHPAYMTFHGMCDRLENEGLKYIAHTTTTNCSSHNKYRLILPYEKPIIGDLARAAWSLVNQRFDNIFDPSTHDPSRLSFLPADWFESDYINNRGNRVILQDPFNSMRSNISGKPILTAQQISKLTPTSVLGQIRNSKKLCSAININNETTGTSKFCMGRSNDWIGWRLLENLERSPLIKDWMIKELPKQEGSRDYRFCKAVIKQSFKHNYPIRIETVVSLATQWSRKYLLRECNGIEDQAQNALLWCYANKESCLSMGKDPHQSEN